MASLKEFCHRHVILTFFISLSITGTVLLKNRTFYIIFMGSGNVIDKNCSTEKFIICPNSIMKMYNHRLLHTNICWF